MARQLRDQPVTVMFTATDKQWLKEQADQDGKAVSEWLRDKALREREHSIVTLGPGYPARGGEVTVHRLEVDEIPEMPGQVPLPGME